VVANVSRGFDQIHAFQVNAESDALVESGIMWNST